MNKTCACGGDMILEHPQNKWYFRSRCGTCGVKHTQRKRQAKGELAMPIGLARHG